MKIKLPEKRFFTPGELAKRWECSSSDVMHLIDTGELDWAEKRAAIRGKRSIFYGRHPYQFDASRPCFVPVPPDECLAIWEELAREDELIVDVPIPFDGPVDNVSQPEIMSKFDKILDEFKSENPEYFELVILLQDVLEFESRYLQREQGGGQKEKPLGANERQALVKQIGALSLALAEQSKKYKRGEKPNGLQIATVVGEIIDALPGSNAAGLGSSSIRDSIRQGIELLTAIQQ